MSAEKGSEGMEKAKIAPGAVVGRWTVLDCCAETARGEKKWLCRCACGTHRYVLERSLKYGSSHSCGCFRKEQHRKAVSVDLTGRTFGALTVLGLSPSARKDGGLVWTCRCRCGTLYDCAATLLTTGKRTHCGCQTHRGRPADIAGQRFHRLVAEYMLSERDDGGNVVWHCKCDCGNEIDVPYSQLVYSNMKSCGCQKKEHDRKLGTYLTHVAGTSVEMLRSKKLPANNTTGCKGVYRIHGKYLAKIVFQKKQYRLGTYDSLEAAAAVRKEAERTLFDGAAAHCEQWKKYADADPEWAELHPICISVRQSKDALEVTLLPDLRKEQPQRARMAAH